jgi:hypothetical protein
MRRKQSDSDLFLRLLQAEEGKAGEKALEDWHRRFFQSQQRKIAAEKSMKKRKPAPRSRRRK